MARSEENREDLLRDATAYVERAELAVAGWEEPVFIGFRKDGAASFFFGQNRVYHFNATGELRRAYLDGLLYKAEGGQLCSLRRERSAVETSLLRHDLSGQETSKVLYELKMRLERLVDALRGANFAMHGQVPAEWAVAERVAEWVSRYGPSVAIAERTGLN